MLAVDGWQRVGVRVAGASVVAAALELAIAFVLVIAYSALHPGWTFH